MANDGSKRSSVAAGEIDADKEGFLRSETSLIQTTGRAARNVDGQVIMYADRVTDATQREIGETNRRPDLQVAYNAEHGIDPQTIRKKVSDILELVQSCDAAVQRRSAQLGVRQPLDLAGEDLQRLVLSLEEEMRDAAKKRRFEYAARLRDEIQELKRELRDAAEATR